jgi:hypothetical protein
MVFNPVYLDGPLAGQEFKTASSYAQAYDFDGASYDISSALSALDPLSLINHRIVTYQAQRLGFSLNKKAAVFYVSSCTGKYDIEDVICSIVKPELTGRFEFHPYVI